MPTEYGSPALVGHILVCHSSRTLHYYRALYPSTVNFLNGLHWMQCHQFEWLPVADVNPDYTIGDIEAAVALASNYAAIRSGQSSLPPRDRI